MSSRQTSSSDNDQQNDFSVDCQSSNTKDEMCPICLLEDVTLVKTLCGHTTCLPCMKRLLTVPVLGATTGWHETHPAIVPNDDADLDIPTRGRCPMCRQPVCLFELEWWNGPQKDTLAISKNHNLSSTDLAGRVYIRNRSVIGNHSIHFPEANVDGDSSLPYIDFSMDEQIQEWSRGRNMELKIKFQPDCHFYEATRSFHGRIKWCDDGSQDRLDGSMFWEYSISFSADYSYATRGMLVKRRDPCRNPDIIDSTYTFRLDGRWKVSWPDIPKRVDRTFVVHNNTVFDGGVAKATIQSSNFVPLSGVDKEEVYIHPLQTVPRWESEDGPSIGETIEIDAPPGHPRLRMLWTREAYGSRHLDVVSIGCGSSQIQYQSLSLVQTLSSRPVYIPSTVWGNTFCQALTVGLASYHFMENSADGAYISYENEQASRWPPLDNGSPIPNKMWFTEVSFDPSERVFRGKIDWLGTHGTTWQGCRWWRSVFHS